MEKQIILNLTFSHRHCKAARIYGTYLGPDMVLLEEATSYRGMIHRFYSETKIDDQDFQAITPLGLYVTIESLYRTWRFNNDLTFFLPFQLTFQPSYPVFKKKSKAPKRQQEASKTDL